MPPPQDHGPERLTGARRSQVVDRVRERDDRHEREHRDRVAHRRHQPLGTDRPRGDDDEVQQRRRPRAAANPPRSRGPPTAASARRATRGGRRRPRPRHTSGASIRVCRPRRACARRPLDVRRANGEYLLPSRSADAEQLRVPRELREPDALTSRSEADAASPTPPESQRWTGQRRPERRAHRRDDRPERPRDDPAVHRQGVAARRSRLSPGRDPDPGPGAPVR